MALDRDLIGRVRALDEYDLRRLVMFARGLLRSRQGDGDVDASVRRGKVTYRREMVRCGKDRCAACPHGPYWYAYWREGGRLRSRYVGKELPDTAGVTLARETEPE